MDNTGNQVYPVDSGSGGFTAEEQAVYDFISSNVSTLESIYEVQSKAVREYANGSVSDATDYTGEYFAMLDELGSQWMSFPAARGRVGSLESQFEICYNDLVDIDTGITRILDGGSSDYGIEAIDAYNRDVIILKTMLDNQEMMAY